jgi:hypothetical protein
VKLPVTPPSPEELVPAFLARPNEIGRYMRLMGSGVGPAPEGTYRHWDTFRHTSSSTEYSAEEQWLAIRPV